MFSRFWKEACQEGVNAERLQDCPGPAIFYHPFAWIDAQILPEKLSEKCPRPAATGRGR
jgi:hypothetical protein